MKILITGAGGYLGRETATNLAAQHDVYCLVRPGSQAQDLPGRIIEQDLTQPLSDSSLPEKVDAVLHLAQSRHYREFPERAEDVFEVNVASTLHLLQYARKAGARQFVLASSGGITGYQTTPIKETDPANPPGFYLTSKYQAEMLVQSFTPYFSTAILRYFFIYGPHQSGRMVPMFIERLQKGQPITLDGDEGMRLNPIYLSDAAKATERALSLQGHHVINVAGPDVTSIRGMVTLMAERLGVEPVWQPTGVTPLGHMVADIEGMRLHLGAPEVGMGAGIEAILRASGTPIAASK